MLSGIYLSLSDVLGMCSLALAGVTFVSALGALGAWVAIRSIESEVENALQQDVGNLAKGHYTGYLDHTVLMVIEDDKPTQ